MSAEDDVARPERAEAPPAAPDVEQFAGGEIRSFRGRVDAWLLAVYAVLAVWGVYYLVRFWGGLGPGQMR
ncbi:MAG: hypothetical protein ACREM3_25055 [Candidatus Rokuibacteriota bacterium]